MTLQLRPGLSVATLEESLQAALEAVRSDDAKVRAKGAAELGPIAAPEDALRELGRLASDDNVGVRMAAVSALASTPWRGRLDLLAKGLDDDDLGVALVAAQGLTLARDGRAVETLREIAAEKKLRFDALEALFEQHDRGSLPEAERLFRGFFTPPFVKGIAALMLAREGHEKARQHLVSRLGTKRAEERPMLLVHALASRPDDLRPLIDQIASSDDDYLRESALLALTKVDASQWPRVQEALARQIDAEPGTSAELLLGLFEIDATRAGLIAAAHAAREGALGDAARAVEVALLLRERFPSEVLLRCA